MSVDMRYILIDWMYEVSMDFCLKNETFHKSVLILDSYMEKESAPVKIE